MLLGFDRPAAEVFVNLITGASLPDKGEVASLGRPTSAIADSDEWLAFVERFGIVSDRIVLLEAMTVAQNLAISFDLESRACAARDHDACGHAVRRSGHRRRRLDTRVADAAPLLRSQIFLARALALDPVILRARASDGESVAGRGEGVRRDRRQGVRAPRPDDDRFVDG